MTNQEASKIIKDGIEDMSLDFADDEQNEALEMAIKALEQESSGEWIRRQDVIKVLTKNRVHFYDMVKITSEIKKLPSVKQEPCSNCCNGNQIEKAKLCQKSYLAGMEHKQEPKTGHWIEHNWEDMREKGYYRCSVCGTGYQRFVKGIRKSDVPYIDGQEYTLKNIDNYCPNCGAKMVEPQESESDV